MHYRTSTRGTRTVQHEYGTLQSSTTIRSSFVMMLKITINKHQNHSIPAVWGTEIASHPISTCDQHFCLLSSLPSITRSNPWHHTLLSATVILYEGSQSLTITCSWSPGLLCHQQTHTVFLIINTSLLFPFKGPLSICHHLHCFSALCRIPYTLKILHFKFILSLSNLFHSFSHLIKFCYFTATLLTYKNPCILLYKDNKSLQFSSPISFSLILHSHFGTSDYLTSVNISKVIFQPYGQPYRHSLPSYIVVQWLWFTHTSDMASSSTICPRFLASLSYTLCAASIQPQFS